MLLLATAPTPSLCDLANNFLETNLGCSNPKFSSDEDMIFVKEQENVFLSGNRGLLRLNFTSLYKEIIQKPLVD